MKHKNIKIKRHKYNFYNKNKKKSKSKQALAIILTIVIAALLGVVGFGLGKPLIDYFSGNKTPDTSSSGWTPPAETAETADTSAPASTDVAETVETEEPITTDNGAFMLPDGSALNQARLDHVISTAKAQGYTSVVITLKDDTGNFLYKSEIEEIRDSEAVTGTLTAKQIYDTITASGMMPQARISTLKDHTSTAHVSDIRFTTSDDWGWLDAAAADGGRPWVSPFEPKTAEFMAEIITELAAAGFEKIILADMKYPPFKKADEKYLSHLPIKDEEKRLEALWSVITACSTAANNSGAEVLLEMRAADMDAADRNATSAEAVGDKDKLKTVELLITLDAESISGQAGVNAFTSKMNGLYSGQGYSVLIDKNGYSAAEYEDIVSAFSDTGISVFSE